MPNTVRMVQDVITEYCTDKLYAYCYDYNIVVKIL